jgi:hypothetical protein
MARLPYAAKQLIKQASEAKPATKAKPVDEPDGLGVHRTVSFNKATSTWLKPLLEEIDDPRIASLEVDKGGLLEVTFVTTIAADDRTPFPLEAAEQVTS